MDHQKIGTKIAIKFLRDYHEFGSRGHLVSASVQKNAIESSELNNDDKKLLAIKIFSEFMSSLEDLAALCIAVRHRDEGLGLIYSYLTYNQSREPFYPQTSITDMYKEVRDGNGLHTGLLLPTLDELISLRPHLAETEVPTYYSESNILLSQAAEAYLTQNRAFVRAYNKTKHGFVVVNDRHVFQIADELIKEDEAWIAAKNPSFDPEKNTDIPLVELFSVHLNNTTPIYERLVTIRGAIMVISELVASLLEEELITCSD